MSPSSHQAQQLPQLAALLLQRGRGRAHVGALPGERRLEATTHQREWCARGAWSSTAVCGVSHGQSMPLPLTWVKTRGGANTLAKQRSRYPR